jgi:very-short-patch-repair endonuclease
VGKVKNSNHFCGKSCAASYNNANKTHGTRRSKLEKFIENKLRKKFPTLEITTNDIVATSFELDFYFPTIKLALEINGIFHREAIYGNEKLRKIQLNDSRKSSVCLTRGIQLVIYNDIIKNFTSESGESAWLQIESLINPYF